MLWLKKKKDHIFWSPHRMTPFFQRNLTLNATYFCSVVGTCTSLSYLSAPHPWHILCATFIRGCKDFMQKLVFSEKKNMKYILPTYTPVHLHKWIRNYIRPKKIKSLFALLAWKSGGSLGPSFFFFFFLIWMQEKCNTIHVCAFLGMQNLELMLILVLKGVVFLYIWLKNLLGQLFKNSNILFEHFCQKMQNWVSKKKKAEPLSVGRKRANKHLFFRPNLITRVEEAVACNWA